MTIDELIVALQAVPDQYQDNPLLVTAPTVLSGYAGINGYYPFPRDGDDAPGVLIVTAKPVSFSPQFPYIAPLGGTFRLHTPRSFTRVLQNLSPNFGGYHVKQHQGYYQPSDITGARVSSTLHTLLTPTVLLTENNAPFVPSKYPPVDP